jgi:manganese efflux pump family protein
VLVKIIALVLPLALETFAVSAALAVGGRRTRRRIIPTWVLFAASEAGMPLVGLAIGRPLGAIGNAADYVAVAVVLALAVHMLRESEGEHSLDSLLDHGAVATVVLFVSASLDELAIGFTLGLLRLPVLPVIAVTAVQAFVISWLGTRLGERIGERAREGAERLAGIALALLAVGLLVGALVG